MYIGQDFFPFDSTESIVVGIDFVNDLAAGDTIDSATVTCTVADDSQVSDPDPQSRIAGGPFYPTNTQVTWRFASPVAGCKYLITVTATTTTGAEIITDYTHAPCEVPL